jgi:hypothetical protein
MKNGTQKETNTNDNPSVPPELRAQIEIRAYHLWRADGGRHGKALNHWLQAEREIANYARTNPTIN